MPLDRTGDPVLFELNRLPGDTQAIKLTVDNPHDHGAMMVGVDLHRFAGQTTHTFCVSDLDLLEPPVIAVTRWPARDDPRGQNPRIEVFAQADDEAQPCAPAPPDRIAQCAPEPRTTIEFRLSADTWISIPKPPFAWADEDLCDPVFVFRETTEFGTVYLLIRHLNMSSFDKYDHREHSWQLLNCAEGKILCGDATYEVVDLAKGVLVTEAFGRQFVNNMAGNGPACWNARASGAIREIVDPSVGDQPGFDVVLEIEAQLAGPPIPDYDDGSCEGLTSSSLLDDVVDSVKVIDSGLRVVHR